MYQAVNKREITFHYDPKSRQFSNKSCLPEAMSDQLSKEEMEEFLAEIESELSAYYSSCYDFSWYSPETIVDCLPVECVCPILGVSINIC